MATKGQKLGVGAAGLSVPLVLFLYHTFVTQASFDKYSADTNVTKADTSAFEAHKKMSETRIAILEAENKALLQRIAANEASLSVLRSMAREKYE